MLFGWICFSIIGLPFICKMHKVEFSTACSQFSKPSCSLNTVKLIVLLCQHHGCCPGHVISIYSTLSTGNFTTGSSIYFPNGMPSLYASNHLQVLEISLRYNDLGVHKFLLLTIMLSMACTASVLKMCFIIMTTLGPCYTVYCNSKGHVA